MVSDSGWFGASPCQSKDEPILKFTQIFPNLLRFWSQSVSGQGVTTWTCLPILGRASGCHSFAVSFLAVFRFLVVNGAVMSLRGGYFSPVDVHSKEGLTEPLLAPSLIIWKLPVVLQNGGTHPHSSHQVGWLSKESWTIICPSSICTPSSPFVIACLLESSHSGA